MDRKFKYSQRLALLLCLVLILTAMLGTTLAIVVTQTPSLINTFLSGFDPTGSLTLQKTISHPFGGSYTVPDNDHTRFTFTVELGADNADKTFGEFKTDSEGILTITLRAGSSVTIPDLPLGTQAVVTEQQPGPGFTAPEPQTLTIGRGENLLSIVNPYNPAAPSEVLTVTGAKTLVGRDWQAGDRFTFALEVRENGIWRELGQQTVEYSPDDPEFHTFDFTQIIREYPLDQAGTYSFRVIEKEGSIGGITYDKAESKFDITVGDEDMDGHLEIQSIVSPSANTAVDQKNRSIHIDFQNKYAPVGSDAVTIDITKNLTDTSGQNKSPAGFTFGLYDEEGNLIQTSQPTDADGKTEIRLIYETKHAGQTFRYTLKEVNDGQPGMVYDENIHHIQVDVTGSSDGTVDARIRELTPEPTAPQAPAQTEPAAGTVVTEPEITETEPAELEVTEPEITEPVQLIEETGPETTGQLPVALELTVTESALSIPAAASAALEEAPAVPRTEPSEESQAEQLSVVFRNTYEPRSASLPITGKKQLTGRTLKAEDFYFNLYETEAGFTIPEGAAPVRTAPNGEDGTFRFGELTFTETGWYYYVVTEDASAALGGVTYDASRYHVRVFVEDIGGVLSVQEVTVENTAGEAAEILFRNTYQPAPAELILSGTKLLTGRQLQAEEFTFHLYEATYLTSYGFTQGQLYARSANDLDAGGEVTGEFSFRIEYPEPGTYHYIITEAAGDETGMTYDETRYGIEVVVQDDQAGQLQARVTRLVKLGAEGTQDTQAEEILFCNTYKAPEETKPDETTEATTEPDDTDPTTEPTTPDSTGGSENVTLPGTPEDTQEAQDTKLPQTGQLWWPVPILLLLGLLFIVIGLVRRRGAYHD